MNAVFWVLRTGSPWRDLPPDYGDWKNTYRRFCRWRDNGVWESILEAVIDDPDFEWLMIDASHVKAHRDGCGAAGGTQGAGWTKRGSTPRSTSHGMSVRFLITEGARADCRVAGDLIEGIEADFLLADRGYDTDSIVAAAKAAGMESAIPPKCNRIEKRELDLHIYKQRHLVENAFMHLKRWRGIATRYAKTLSSFVASVQIRCFVMWLHIS